MTTKYSFHFLIFTALGRREEVHLIISSSLSKFGENEEKHVDIYVRVLITSYLLKYNSQPF